MKMSKLEKKFVNGKRQAEKNVRIAEQLFGEIDSSDVKMVLEVGCGIGMLASYLAKRYKWHVTGVDLDPEQIERAKSEHTENEYLKFFEADATKLSFEKGEFDLVLSFDVLHHIPCWDRAIEEISRILKPGSFYVFNDLAFSRLAARIFRGLLRNYMGVYVMDDIIHHLKRNNFEILHAEKPESVMPMKHFGIVVQKS